MQFRVRNLPYRMGVMVLGFGLTFFLFQSPVWKRNFPQLIVPSLHRVLLPIMPIASEDNSLPHNYTYTQHHSCYQQVRLDPCGCSRTLQVARCPQGTTITESSDQSSCSSWATLRGPGQKVVSYSVYGKFPADYHRGMEVLAGEVAQMYPGWTIRLYLDMSLEQQLAWACALACNHTHLDLCDVRNLTGVSSKMSSGKFWRFYVMGDPLVDRYIVRDVDSPILQREVDAVNQWISLGRCYHTMRDTPSHGVPMLGGMWGGCNTWQPHLALQTRVSLMKAGESHIINDQIALWRYLWQWIKKNVTSHDSYTCSKFPGSLAFPTRRVNRTFVGMRTYRTKFENDAVWQNCPEQCRPINHKDWELC